MNSQLVLSFLDELAQNNNKDWMDAHRSWYEEAKEEFKVLVTQLLSELSVIDEGLVGLAPKHCIFRINRDIRFSKDKAPYKNNFGAYMSEGGKKSPNAGYYLHIQPHGESFIGGGMYHPSSEVISKVRQEIDYNASELKKIVSKADFQEYYGTIQGDKLKKAPKGYETDHPNIELLKLKDYVVIHKLSDDEIKSENFKDDAIRMFKTIEPFIRYLNVAIS
ncbi:uncharacterized protein (TIGR02453 family) [Catalinimonas alkaloidigena]|uniref:DUF2461 domain-containing protein n=1 Tax=Catalinimonas alkaloidigena TaxID=1075417 RepID=UPI002404FBFA|nr:DUF2461 domain-containing protein [Catalinimonas alkaloidigena]MDF9795795.1 uncharacterized protein (TIGR02453 family) [Catalinimonas alkaloidigena]